jgi:uncharacterized protein YndB with AHSA1/START domain
LSAIKKAGRPGRFSYVSAKDTHYSGTIILLFSKNTIMANNNDPIVVETTKEFRVPVEQLYQAWNSAEKLKEWWHPFSKNLSRVVNDLKPGGTVEYGFEGDQKCQITGKYDEVVENKRLVYSWNWDIEHDEMKNGDYNLTIDFIPGEGKSRLNIKQEGFIDEKATNIHRQGWDRGLEALRSYLENNIGNESKAGGQQTQANTEAKPGPKDEEVSTGKGPKPIGPNQQTWDNPKPGEEVKKEIDDQLARLKKLGENPSEHDPKIDELNKDQDIESRNEGPEHEKKSENNTQDNFDPARHKTEAPSH